MSGPHVVEALAFEVDFATPEQAWQLEAQVAGFAQGLALQVIDEVFSAALGDDEVLQIDALEIDLGTVDGDDLAVQWATRLREQLGHRLAELRLARDGSGIATPTAAPPAAPAEAQTAASQPLRWQSRAQAELDALLHFLRHGRLPWGLPSHTDPVQLARRCAQTSGAALLRGLRALPDAAAVRARLVRQFPADWLCRLERALALPTPSSTHRPAANPFDAADGGRPAAWPARWADAEARLRAAWTPAADVATPPTQAPAVSAAEDRPATPADPATGRSTPLLRRFKALLVDDAPLLDEDDVAALLTLWPALFRDHPDALRAYLLTWGAYARVRRRMATLWPEPLLMQLPGLWLPQAEQARLAAVLSRASAETPAERRQRWQRLLRTLLAGDGPAPLQATDLLAAWHGGAAIADAPDAGWRAGIGGRAGPAVGADAVSPADAASPADARPAPDLRRQLQALTAGPPEAGRAGLRRLCTSWTHQRLLAAMLTPGQLVRCLGWWLPADQAVALGALAFDPLPAAWRTAPDAAAAAARGDAHGAERRCQWFLHHIATTGDSAVTAAGLVRTWWQALALQHQRDAGVLLARLRAVSRAPEGAGDASVEQQRARAWLRWLDAEPHPTATRAGEDVMPAAPVRPTAAMPVGQGHIDHLTGALRAADWPALEQAWAALAKTDTPSLRTWARRASGLPACRRLLGRCPPPLWQRWLSLLLPDLPAVAQAAERLSRGQGPHLQPALREQVLTWVLMQPTSAQAGDSAADAARVTLLLQHLVDATPAASVATVHALALHAADHSGEATLATLLRDAAGQLLKPAPAMPPRVTHDTGPAFDLAHWLAQPAEPARQAVRRQAGTATGLAALAAAVDGPLGRPLLALFLGDEGATALVQVLSLLKQEVAAHGGVTDDTAAALQRQLLQAALWTPPPVPGLLAAHLLERAAARLDLPPPLLVQRLQARAAGNSPPLLRAWAAGRSPVDLGPGSLAPKGPPQRADPRSRPDAAGVADVVALLRGGARPDPLTPDQARRLLALLARGEARVHAALALELESPLAARRVAQALAPDQLLLLVRRLRPADGPALARTWPALQALVQTSDAAATGWPAVARVVLRELFEHDRPLHPAQLLQRAEQALGRSAARSPEAVQAASSAALNRPVAHASVPLASAPPDDADAATGADRPDGPLFIDNAGLVLLAPYLPRLFGMCSLTDGKAFVDTAASARAVLLSQYLVTGETACAEPLLLLNKLLCGLPLQAAVPREIALTGAEREAADGLLLAVIAHWSALGKTSPAGLRQTFLQREGRLAHVGDAWQLEVPPQTFDMLLDRLPWGYATLRFPWMPEVLHVQWR